MLGYGWAMVLLKLSVGSVDIAVSIFGFVPSWILLVDLNGHTWVYTVLF